MAALKANLNLTPEDAVRFFAAKGDRLAFDFTDVWGEANVHAFTVAKATTLDVLGAIRTEVAKAIGPGQTFEAFKRTLRPQLEALGWWGQQEVLDGGTGELTKVQLGSVRRLRTIYQTNVQTAYMAGRFKRYLDNVADRPFWKYVSIMDGRTRPAHAALNGKVWRWDDPIWEVIWPPNGWGCRCRVIALTQAEFEASGAALESGADAIVELEVPIGRTGETAMVKGVKYVDEAGQQKVFRPDPGWDYNPGSAWARFDPAGFKGEADAGPALTPPSTSGVIKSVPGLQTWADVGRPDLRDPRVSRLPDPGQLPAAPDRDAALRMLVDALLPNGQTSRVVKTPVEDVVIRQEWLPHIVAKVDNARERFATYILPTLEKPFEVWLTPYTDGTYRKRYIGRFQGRNDLLVVVRENRDGSLWWEVYNVLNGDATRMNKFREGTLLFGEKVGDV
jgi:SPP1 gp7 family putative phage head morphogenesis protein